MEDKGILNFEELEGVSGGSVKQWSKAEKTRLHEMKANYDRLCDGYAAGRVTKAELDEAFDELSAYIRETDEKYN